jgi:hypothetical protein
VSEHDDDQDLDQDDQPQKPGVRQRLKAIEDENKQLRENLAKAQQAERRETFRDAGFDLDDKITRAAIAGYSQDVTPEAVAAWGLDIGLLKPPAPTTPPDAQAAHQRMLEAAAGGERPPSAQWGKGDMVGKSPEQIVAAQEAGFLNEYLGLPT